jgi:hypothetical protein
MGWDGVKSREEERKEVTGMPRYCWIIFGCVIGGLVSASALGAPTVYVIPSEAAARVGDPVTFEFWVKAEVGTTFDLRGYQITSPCSLPMQSGFGGVVDNPLMKLSMDRAEWVMHLTSCALGACGEDAANPGACSDPPGPRLAFGGYRGEFVTVDDSGYYLAEVTYAVQSGDEGTVLTFDAVDRESMSFLRDPTSAPIPAIWEGATLTIVTTVCETDEDCADGDFCTLDECINDGIECRNTCEPRPYADVYPVPWGDGAVEIMDTLCILDAAAGTGDCLMPIPDLGNAMIGDIYPCPPPAGSGPDGAVEIMDTLGVLDAAAGSPGCAAMCVCE